MLSEIVNNPDLKKYLVSFDTGRIMFLEGEDSQDLYVLVSGELDILKGNKKIREITEKGALFGEMSFLLGTKRTATVKARSDVRAIRIPKEEVANFLQEFPAVTETITRVLALRLSETTQMLYGLREFCDQLPDAVILTDRDSKVLTWNTAAEKLYGREWSQMRNKPVEEIYEEPETYRTYIEEVQSRYSVREKILKIKHPEKGTRFISTSTTILYDGQHNFQGVISLGRDVTAVRSLERRYRLVRYWSGPFLLLLGLAAIGIFYVYPYFTGRHVTVDERKHGLRNLLAKDYLLLKSLLNDPFSERDRPKTTLAMKNFFKIQESASMPYMGLILLDRDKRVFDAYSTRKGTEVKNLLGSSYAAIGFEGGRDSLHRVLTLYRTDEKHPMGHKNVEVTFEMNKDNQFQGWLVFQMDVDLLQRKYGIDEKGLAGFRFKKP